MERLHHKILLAAVLLLISSGLLVSLRNGQSALDDSVPDQLTQRNESVQPFSRGRRLGGFSAKPARKQFRAQSSTFKSASDNKTATDRDPRARYSTFVTSAEKENQLGLPELDFHDESKGNEIDRVSDFPAKAKPDSTLTKTPNDMGGHSDDSAPRIQPAADSVQAETAAKSKAPPEQKPASPQLAKLTSTGRMPARRRVVKLQIAPAVVNSYIQRVRYANSLARRGAVSSAFEELKGSLKLLAEAIDQLQKTQSHSNAIHQGFTALQEVSDLANWSNDLSVFVAGHDTDVLRDHDLSQMTFHEARLAYLGYAEKKLVEGCQNLPLAGETFRSLGKVYLMQGEYSNESAMSQAKSMLMFRLATGVNPTDAAAARELGVLYAKYNHFKEAKQLLVQSLRVRNDSSTWNNLAKIHRSLGENQLAWQAANEATYAASQRQKTGLIHWTDPENFNNVQSMIDPPIMTAQRTFGQPGSSNQPNMNLPNQNRRR